MPDKIHIIYCDCAHYDLVDRRAAREILGALKASGLPVSRVADLCGLCAGGDERLSRWAEADRLIVIACQPRAVRWLFHACGIDPDEETTEFFNARDEGAPAAIAARLNVDPVPQEDDPVEKPAGWVPWFPVIDHSRCINCKKCMDFCLFGVYALSPEGRVRVSRPHSCKTNCPACARVCPQGAVIFPKHDSAPINGGPDGSGVDASEAGIDHGALLQGDILDKIRRRGGTGRFSAAPREQISHEKTAGEAGVPADVLKRLSPDELAEVMRRFRESGSAPAGERFDENAVE